MQITTSINKLCLFASSKNICFLLNRIAYVSVICALSFFICLSNTTPASAETKKSHIIDRAYFFKQFRSQFYPIREKDKHLIDRYERVFNYWDSQAHLKDLRWLAYILATTYHETGRRIKAVRECFGKTDAASIACVTRMYRRGRIKRNYARIDPKTGKAYFGRGHVQLTWDWNYKRMGKELNMGDEIYINPDLALHPDTSVAILAQGMIKGLFTGKRLSKYFNASSTNWGGARRIVNGLDKYKLIGGYGRKFHATLRTIPSDIPVAEDDCTRQSVPQSCLTKLNSQLAVLNTQYDDLNKQYKNTFSENVALKSKVEAQAKEIADLKAQLPDTTDALAELQQKYKTLETRFNDIETENNNTKAENTRLVALADDLQTKLDDAITTGSTGTDSELLKKRLEQVEQQQKALDQKLTQVTSEQTRLANLSTSLAEKQQTLDTQIQDIEISRQALQTRETNLLNDQEQLKQREQTLNEEALELSSKEDSLKQFETDLNEKKQALEDYYSKPWYSRMWDNVASKWREE